MKATDNGYTGETRVGEGAKLELSASATLDNNYLTLENGAKFIKAENATHDLSKGTLNVNGQATYQGNLEAEGAWVNFKVSETYQPDGSPLLDITTGYAKLNNATVTASVAGISAAVTRGDNMTLFRIKDVEHSSMTGIKTAKIDDQGLLSIELGQLDWSADGKATAKILSVAVNEKTKTYAEGFLGGAVVLVGAADHAAEGLAAAKESALAAGGNAIFAGFASVGGGSMRYETGSHVDANGYNLIGGVASGSQFAAGQLTVGAFAEYGDGDYSTHNSFASGKVKGKGDTEYRGAGFLAQFDFDNGFYLDGTLRTGKVDNDFHSTEINGKRTAYDTSNRYYGAHVGVGHLWKLGADSFDVSAQYLWTHQKGDKVSVKGATAVTLDFDDVDSSRLRVGARYTRALNPTLSGYAGVAWEKEFDGKAESTLNGNKVEAPELKGDTGRLELGLTTAFSANSPVTLDIGLQGYWGQREGVIGSAKLNYRF
jgi:hypothetical protein